LNLSEVGLISVVLAKSGATLHRMGNRWLSADVDPASPLVSLSALVHVAP
jgi:hypothetical protein